MDIRQIQILILALSVPLFGMPRSGCADCIIIDTPYKFEVICSGYNPLPPVPASRLKNVTAGKPVRLRSLNRERSGAVSPVALMNEEEAQIMYNRNRQDGYRANRSRGDRNSGQSAAAQDKRS